MGSPPLSSGQWVSFPGLCSYPCYAFGIPCRDISTGGVDSGWMFGFRRRDGLHKSELEQHVFSAIYNNVIRPKRATPKIVRLTVRLTCLLDKPSQCRIGARGCPALRSMLQRVSTGKVYPLPSSPSYTQCPPPKATTSKAGTQQPQKQSVLLHHPQRPKTSRAIRQSKSNNRTAISLRHTPLVLPTRP